MALGVYKIAPETHRTPLPCGKDVVYTARERERERERDIVQFCQDARGRRHPSQEKLFSVEIHVFLLSFFFLE